MCSKKKNRTNETDEGKLIKKNINLTTIILYGSMILASVLIWFFFYELIAKNNKANLWMAILTTLIASGVIGLINTLVLNTEKDKVLDASIERVRIDFLEDHFVAESIFESLKRGFDYCNNKVDFFRVYAVSTNQILPFVDEKKNDININICHLMVRGYGENMPRDEIESDNEIKANIKNWEALKPECIKELRCIRYNKYSLNYYCIFDNKFITFGQYIVNERINPHKVDTLQPFSITDKTEVGKQIIKNSIDQFDSYFVSEKKKRINFNEFANRYDTLRSADKELIQLLIKKCQIEINAKILDFGCGTGNYIREFQERGFNDISGFDTSEKMREIASEKTHVPIYEQFNDVDVFFDFVFLIDVIHFIENTNLLAKKLYSKCANKAMIAIATQSYRQIKSRGYGKYFPSAIEIDLERYHGIDTLIKAFEGVGFSLKEKIKYKENTIRKLDFVFFNKVKNKCFSMFELIDEDEFNRGIKEFEKALESAKDNEIKESYAGKTILLFSKDRAVD